MFYNQFTYKVRRTEKNIEILKDIRLKCRETV